MAYPPCGAGEPSSLSVLSKTDLNGDGSETIFTFTGAAGLTAEGIEVYVDGLSQEPSGDYTVEDDGTDLLVTFGEAPADGANIQFRAYR